MFIFQNDKLDFIVWSFDASITAVEISQIKRCLFWLTKKMKNKQGLNEVK